MSFASFSGQYYIVRLFASQTDILFLNKDQFTALIGSSLIPDRLKEYISKSYSATQEEIEE